MVGFMETESRKSPGAGRRGKRVVFNEDKIPSREAEKVLDMDGNDDCTIMQISMMPLNLKMVKTVTSVLCTICHYKKYQPTKQTTKKLLLKFLWGLKNCEIPVEI